jgi:hypothetical protein
MLDIPGNTYPRNSASILSRIASLHSSFKSASSSLKMCTTTIDPNFRIVSKYVLEAQSRKLAISITSVHQSQGKRAASTKSSNIVLGARNPLTDFKN